MSNKKPDIIYKETLSPDQLSAWERWQLPSMDQDLPDRENAFNIRIKKTDPPLPQAVDDEVIKPPTAEEIEAIRQAAFEEGLKEGRAAGHAEGYQAGFKRGESDVKAAVTRLGQIIRVLLEPIPKNDDELESAVLDLVKNICKRVVQRELKLDSSGLKKVVSTALESLTPGYQRIRIHLNPEDCDMITRYLREQDDFDDNWRVVPHATITPGGCIVETDNSLIDARAEKRLAAVIQQVYEQQKQALEQEDSQQGGMEQLLDEVEAFPPEDDIVVEGDGEQDGL